MMWLTFTVVVLGGLVTGAWLVINGHPWFGLLAMLIGASISVHGTGDDCKKLPEGDHRCQHNRMS